MSEYFMLVPMLLHNLVGLMSLLRYLENQHSDRQPERHRHAFIFLRADERCCRGGRNSYVTRQRPRSVHLSHLADETPAVGSFGDIDLRNSSHGLGTLRRRRLSRLVQGTNIEL